METREQAEKLYKKVNTFILSCIGEDGYPLTKAVSPSKHRDSLKELYFCTNTSSKFVAGIEQNSKISVYFYSRRFAWKGCLLKGNVEIVSDLDIKKSYWQSKFKHAYPQQSFTDPDFCVIKFVPKSGRFYSWYKPVDFSI